MIDSLTRKSRYLIILPDMPALAELGQRIAHKLGLHDLRPAVREETRQCIGLRHKLEAILGGSDSRTFTIEQPIYSAWAWNFPTDISVVRMPQGFELTVRTQGNHPYGMQVRLQGRRVSVFELVARRDPVPYLLKYPWELVHGITDRVIMATSDDPIVKENYRLMRVSEQRDFEERSSALVDDAYPF